MPSQNAQDKDLTKYIFNFKCPGDGHLDQAQTSGEDTMGPNNIQPLSHNDEDQGCHPFHAGQHLLHFRVCWSPSKDALGKLWAKTIQLDIVCPLQ